MKVIITSRNFNASDHLKDTIEKKVEKLGKYFSNDIVANIMLSTEKGRQKVEATINARGMIFRAEDVSTDAYDGIDKVIEKLSSQMSRFKDKLQRKYKDNKTIMLEEVPEYDEAISEPVVVKRKKFALLPMSVDEAIMQMELVGHTFFVFLNMETDSVNVVYKRKNGDYGLLETAY